MRFLCEMCFLCALSDNFCLRVIFILDKQFSNATAAGFAAPWPVLALFDLVELQSAILLFRWQASRWQLPCKRGRRLALSDERFNPPSP
jgi:hypothetical protein